MSSPKTVPAEFTLIGESPTRGEITLLARAFPSRVTRAALTTGALWLVAAGCIFIPVLHFVLVPGVFIAGIVLGIVRLGDDVSLLHAHGICPRCKVERTFGGSGRFREGSTVHCEGCGCQIGAREIRLDPALHPQASEPVNTVTGNAGT